MVTTIGNWRLSWLAPVLVATIAIALLAACSGPDTGDDGTATTTPTLATEATDAASAPTNTALIPTSAGTVATTPSSEPTAAEDPTSTPTPFDATATQPPSPTVTQTATAEPLPTSTPVASAEFITIRTAETDDLIVALTFDAGADRGYAGDILDILAAEGIVASFGMTGAWAEDNPDLIARMVDEGHMLINHTMSHQSFTGFSTSSPPLPSAERSEELRGVEVIVRDLTGYELAPYFRPPYGDYDDSVIADLQANGYTVNVMWTVDSLGWAGRTVDEITQRVVDGTVPGAIHLFHVGASSQDAAALPGIISALRDQGYEFVTVEDMVGR